MVGKYTRKKANGYVIITDPEAPTQEYDTVQCVHCGRHWRHTPGSGKLRGWCGNCKGFICGVKCLKCVPMEKMLDIMEGKTSLITSITLGGFKSVIG